MGDFTFIFVSMIFVDSLLRMHFLLWKKVVIDSPKTVQNFGNPTLRPVQVFKSM